VSRVRLLRFAQYWVHLGELAERNDARLQTLPTDHEGEPEVGGNSTF
jgi:hypothetical protein